MGTDRGHGTPIRDRDRVFWEPFMAHEALQKGMDMRPDVIFLDIGLPNLSGYEVRKEIRRSEWGRNVFMVAVTGRNEAEDMIQAANCGFERHVDKPMEFGTSREILHTVKVGCAQSLAGPPKTSWT